MTRTRRLELPILDEQPSPALEAPTPASWRPWWRSGPFLMGLAGVVAVVLAFAGMYATGAVAVERDQEYVRAENVTDSRETLAAQVGAACDAGDVRPSPAGDPACRTARAVLSDPTAPLGEDTRALLDTLRGIVSSRPPGPARLDPAQITAAAAQNPALRRELAGDLERAARRAVAAEQGVIRDEPGRTATDVRFARLSRNGACSAIVTYSDGTTDTLPADRSSCGPAPIPTGPPTSSRPPTSTTDPTTSSSDPTTSTTDPTTSSDTDTPTTTG